jgi:hypothetical protein
MGCGTVCLAMRDFTHIPFFSPRAQDHVEHKPQIDHMIARAASLLNYFSESEVIGMLVEAGMTMGEVINAVRAGNILNEGRKR